MVYGYDDLEKDLSAHSGVFVIGKSVFGRNIYAVAVGDGAPRTLIHGGIHARESLSSAVAVKMMENHNGSAICFVPMVNPDGVMLVKYGIESAPEEFRKRLIAVNGGGDFSLWKANGNAVDLNVNFDAYWGKGEQNVRKPSSANYIGAYPFSEPETRALASLTEKYTFTSSLSLHTKGETIYYGFDDCKSYVEYAKILAEATGYALLKSEGSVGGYKDWFLIKGFGAGFTVELGDDNLRHPIGDEYVNAIYQKVEKTAGIAARIGEIIWKNGL